MKRILFILLISVCMSVPVSASDDTADDGVFIGTFKGELQLPGCGEFDTNKLRDDLNNLFVYSREYYMKVIFALMWQLECERQLSNCFAPSCIEIQ